MPCTPVPIPVPILRHTLRRTLAASLAGAVALGGVLVGGAVTSSADAAKTKTWERLANCESGKRWHVNTGNGYYGGLQFSRSTWRAYNGGHFAKRPDNARKKEQIAVAERVLNDQGWGAWPSCSDRLHLSKKQARAAWNDRHLEAQGRRPLPGRQAPPRQEPREHQCDAHRRGGVRPAGERDRAVRPAPGLIAA